MNLQPRNEEMMQTQKETPPVGAPPACRSQYLSLRNKWDKVQIESGMRLKNLGDIAYL
jgi:hypothetical protein